MIIIRREGGWRSGGGETWAAVPKSTQNTVTIRITILPSVMILFIYPHLMIFRHEACLNQNHNDTTCPSLFKKWHQVWFQNRRAKFRKQERLNQQKGGGQNNSSQTNGQSTGQSSDGPITGSNGNLASTPSSVNNKQNNSNSSNNNNNSQSNNNHHQTTNTGSQQLDHHQTSIGMNGTTNIELKPIRVGSSIGRHDFLGVPSFWSSQIRSFMDEYTQHDITWWDTGLFGEKRRHVLHI